MKRLSVLLAVTAAALAAWPAISSAGTYRGVVVGKQRGVLLVAGQSGQVRSVSTSSPAAVGSRVAVTGHSVRVLGRSHTARIRGTVVRRTKHTVFLSAGHRLIAVHSSRALMSAFDQSPTPTSPTNPTPTTTSPTNLAPGTNVSGTVAITPQGDLEDEDMQSLGSTNATQVTATVTNVAAGAVTVTVNGQSLTIPLPAGITLPSTLVGQTITLTLTFANGQTQAEPDDQGEDSNSQGQQSFSGSTGSGDQNGGDQNGGSQSGGGDNG